MPFSSELGMNVYDPSQGVQEGQMAGRAAIDAFQEARRLKLDERKLKMIEEDTARKASATLMRQQGLAKMKELMADGKMSFKDAFFQVAPDLFVDSPEAMGQMVHNLSTEQARETFQNSKLELTRKANAALAQHQANMEEPPEIRLARKTAQLRAEAEQPTTDQGPDTGVSPKSTAAMTLEELRRQQSGKNKPNVQEQHAAKLGELQTQLEKAIDSNDATAIKKAQKELDNFMVFAPQTETQTITTPDGTIVSTTKGPAGSAATQKAAIEKRMSASEETYAQLKETIDQISPSTVGPVGKIKEEYETLANMVNPGSVQPKTTEARQNMRITIQRLLSSFKEAVGGRMNVQEQNMLKEIGDVTGWMESADTARTNLGVLVALEGSRAVREAKKIKKAAPDWSLRAMTEKQIAAGMKDGWVTDEEAMRWFDLHKPPSQTQ